jgi:hypothetical protein
MPSYSRNSRFAVQVLRLAIASAAQGGALLAGSVAAAHAADQPNKFVMTAYINGAGGESLVSGDYKGGLTQALRGVADDDKTATNKCVAYTMTAQLTAAQSLCDEAVKSARWDLWHLSVSGAALWEQRTLQEALAIAYSNRAVVHWLTNDAPAAERDLADAVAIMPNADYVARNLSALHSPHESHENAVAQASAPPHS